MGRRGREMGQGEFDVVSAEVRLSVTKGGEEIWVQGESRDIVSRHVICVSI
jgi:hypothetical protein